MPAIIGTGGQDNLVGTSGDDEFSGLGGDDYQFGLDGNDTFYWYTGHANPLDKVTILDSDGGDTIDGGSGTDRFVVSADSHYTLSGRNSDYGLAYFSLTANGDGSVRFAEMQDWSDYGTVPQSSGTATVAVTLRNVETLVYSAPAVLTDPGYYPRRYFANDQITVGNLSSTAMTGLLVFNLGAGDDMLDARAATNAIAALGGEGNDVLRGGAAADELQGGNGNDALYGGGGTNTLIGGSGDDAYYSDDRNDTIIESVGEGSDTIYTLAAYYISRANVEALAYLGSADFTGIGTSLGETITGGAGHDYLIGQGGDDILIGGAGPNAMQGGTGNDTYYVSDVGDTLIEAAGEGTDTVITSLTSYVLRDNFENLGSNGTGSFSGSGNSADNVLTGGSGTNALFGLDGNDLLVGAGAGNTLTGGRGNDTYVVSNNADQIVELAGEGVDLVRFSGTLFTLADNVENLVVTGGSDTRVTGNTLGNELTGGAARDNLSGGAGNDRLDGGANGDFLSGGAGDDILIGGLGGDELAGGSGADRLVFTFAGDKDLIHDFSRAEGDRIDVVQLLQSVGYTGSDPWTDGYFSISGIAAFGSSGAPATLVRFDPDGSAGAQGSIDLFVATGGQTVVAPGDFIIA
jgi:Ca2+-binding RTX toxin-like protein